MDTSIKCVQMTSADGWYCRIDSVNVAIFPVAVWALTSTGQIVGVVDMGGGLQPLEPSPKCRYLRFEQLTSHEQLQVNHR